MKIIAEEDLHSVFNAMKHIYFDEAGYTGNNLTDLDQPFFAFAAIQIQQEEAQAYLTDLRQRFRISTAEIKGSRLCRRLSSHRVVSAILNDLAANAKVLLCDKAYGLAARLFEYLIEPIIAPVSSAFYNRNFHLFVSNGLYAQAKANDGNAEEFLRRFQSVMSETLNGEHIGLGSSVLCCDESDFSHQLLTLITCHPDKVKEELDSLQNTPIGRWCLELSSSAIWSLLRELGKDMAPIVAFTDESKPLTDQRELFNIMVGRESQSTIQMFGRQSPVLFNLAQPLHLVDSATTPGVQLADIFASATVYAVKNPTSEIATTWRALAPDLLSEESIVSDLSHFDLTQPRAKANAVALHGLIDHSLIGQLNIQEWPSILSQIDRQFGL